MSSGERTQITDQTQLAEAPFGRVVTAMVTPFETRDKLLPTDHHAANVTETIYPDHSQPVDFEAAQDLANWLSEHGSDGLAIAGTTGESPTLTHDEQRDLFKAVAEAVSIPILAGVGSNSTKEAVELSEFVTERELASGLLVVSPYYNRPTQEGIEHYYSAIAEATDLPIVIYNIPGRTGQEVEDETTLRLAHKHPNIRGLKDATGKPDKTKTLIEHPDLPEDFFVYSGDDSLNLQLARSGAVGAISVASHWAGEHMQQMYAALESGDDEMAHDINEKLTASYDFETSAEARNPIPTKAMLRALAKRGVAPYGGYGRSPMVLKNLEQERILETHALEVFDELNGDATDSDN